MMMGMCMMKTMMCMKKETDPECKKAMQCCLKMKMMCMKLHMMKCPPDMLQHRIDWIKCCMEKMQSGEMDFMECTDEDKKCMKDQLAKDEKCLAFHKECCGLKKGLAECSMKMGMETDASAKEAMA